VTVIAFEVIKGAVVEVKVVVLSGEVSFVVVSVGLCSFPVSFFSNRFVGIIFPPTVNIDTSLSEIFTLT